MSKASASITDRPTALYRLRAVNPRLQPFVTPSDSNGFIDASHHINIPMRNLHKVEETPFTKRMMKKFESYTSWATAPSTSTTAKR